MKNLYCDFSSLRNEADVEQSFVRRLLEDLGYSDKEILPKTSLDSLTIGGMRGHPQSAYKPDFGLRLKRRVRWIVEAKAPNEVLDKHEWQPRAYCVLLNGATKGERPVKYHLLTNGSITRLYDPDLNAAILELKFPDFAVGNRKYEKLRDVLHKDNVLKIPTNGPTIRIEKRPLSDVNAAFAWCHQHIYKKDNISQSDAFTEFVKLISLKLMSDRRVRDSYPALNVQDAVEVPATDVNFSIRWIEQNEPNSPNPVSDILFRNFMMTMDRDIDRGIRKRIFETNDHIGLRPETIRGVVKKLEGMYLFGIDADLNGRLFETFLNATMRGKDLGQFFTPRSLVKLGVALSQIKVRQPDGQGGFHTDTIIDACCGSGGFLIDALAEMWRKAENKNLSATEVQALKSDIANNRIVGMDVANAPKLARIARLNMYLHGDGGAMIFHLNALDKELHEDLSDSRDIAKEKRQFLEMIRSGPGFDVALTNPPFAKAYDRSTDEETRILNSYEIGRGVRNSVRSSLLFAERYYDILRPGGRLVTIIDDGILGGEDYAWFRDQLRKWFLIRAVISLPGDAFQRSNARVKTSYLIAEKRDPEKSQDQPPIFMYPCQHVGIDDKNRQRVRASDAEGRELAEQEIAIVTREYERFQSGESTNYSVSPGRAGDRLDVKNCLIQRGRKVEEWEREGFVVQPLSTYVEERTWSGEEIVRKDHPDRVRPLIVRYEGIAEGGDEIVPAESSNAQMYPVREGDIVISNIAASYGSIAVVPPELDGCVVSSEYTVLVPKPDYDAAILQLIFRSPEVRADILLSSSGANRTRARWELFSDVLVPYPKSDLAKETRRLVAEAEAAKRKAAASMAAAQETLETSLNLRSETASMILAAFRPPA